ncbi:MAG: hypothetical protein WED33_08770 [Bacteroidia bacterium]
MKRKIESLSELKIEQARLRMEVSKSEREVTERVKFLGANYPSILLMQVLPFEDSKKELIVTGLGVALSLAMGNFAESGMEILETKLQKLISWVKSKFGMDSHASTSSA